MAKTGTFLSGISITIGFRYLRGTPTAVGIIEARRFVPKFDLKIVNGYFSCLVGVFSLLDWFPMTRALSRPVFISIHFSI
jgi:hypothetical protein